MAERDRAGIGATRDASAPGVVATLAGLVLQVYERSPSTGVASLVTEARFGRSHGRVRLGRDPRQCRLVIPDGRVSARHCEVGWGPDEVSITAFKTTNGTQVGSFEVPPEVRLPVMEMPAELRLARDFRLVIGSGELQVERHPWLDANILGASTAIASVRAAIRQYARPLRPDAPEPAVCILGETGTGKSLVARGLHELSTRCDEPFEALNCGNVTAEMLPSELFGHVKGAFTGAASDRAGILERVDRGTLFIDEVGELPLDDQTRLLQFLDTGEVTRMGSSRPRRVDVRVVSATNRDLAEMVEQGRFRADLYYRLSVLEIMVPPLRERPEDLTLLAAEFLAAAGADASLLDQISTHLGRHHWPGNVRELRNAITRVAYDGPAALDALVAATGRPAATLTELGAAFPRALLAGNKKDADQALKRWYFTELWRELFPQCATEKDVVEMVAERADQNPRVVGDFLKSLGLRRGRG